MKKLLSAAASMLVMFVAEAQVKEVRLRGNFAGLPDTEIVLLNADRSVMARTGSKNGRFEFRANMETGDARRYAIHVPAFGGLGPSMNRPVIWFFVNSGKVTIEATTKEKSIGLKTIKGASCNQEYTRLMNGLPVKASLEKAYAGYNKAFDLYNRESKTNENLLALKKAGSIVDSLDKIQREQIRAMAASKPGNMMAAVMMADYFGWSDSVPQLESILQLFDEKLRSRNYYLIGVAEKIARLKKIEIGQIAPDFTMNDVNGKPVQLSSTRGQYVLLDFWASWCGPCRKENPVVLAAYEKFRNRNFTVFAVSLDTREGDWKKAVEEDKLPWQQLCDLQGSNGGVAGLYEIKGIPANFLLDPAGKIIAVNLRGAALEKALEQCVK